MQELYPVSHSTINAPKEYQDPTFKALVQRFESLGDNCELGMVKRKAGDEESGLLRWAFTPRFPLLLRAFESKFADVFNFENLRPWTDDMVMDRKYDIAFHSNMKSAIFEVTRQFTLSGAPLRECYEQDRAAILKLRDRLLAALEAGGKTFVYKRNPHSPQVELELQKDADYCSGNNHPLQNPTITEMRQLLNELKKYNRNNKLLAVSSGEERPFGHVWEVEKDLYFASLDQNAPYRAASVASYKCWYQILQNANQIISNTSQSSLPQAPERTADVIDRAAKAWSKPNQHNQQSKTRWWFHPTVVAHRNRLIGDVSASGVIAGDISWLRKEQPAGFGHGVSIGCGNGFKELSMIRNGLVGHFTLYEISESRTSQALELAQQWNISDQITIVREVQDFVPRQKFDLVYWNSALHHMLDVKQALSWSRASLSSGGAIYINDCIAPNRLQYSEEYLSAASRFRAALPERLLIAPGGLFSRTVSNIDPEKLRQADPSECADSHAILPSLNEVFPNAVIKYLGGVIYSCALNDVIGNFTEVDQPLLELGLQLDEQYSRLGLNEYIAAFSR
ncbi:class I SAM-dependent methyltransferase [Ensifer adhaerens]|uniref:class I SAM-dependent methyltransferase n=1 Tax=Ensifer adhaerens TaxID=106592 RepID=UPI003F86CCA8